MRQSYVSVDVYKITNFQGQLLQRQILPFTSFISHKETQRETRKLNIHILSTKEKKF